FQSCAEFEAALERARPDAIAVTSVGARSQSPLLSDTEAQHVLRRAAELDVTGARNAPPLAPMVRDRKADDKRREGFKTSVLRDAAAEAGIAPQNVERALAERGLRPSTPAQTRDRRAANVAFDLTAQADLIKGQPAELVYEMVVQGEVSDEDYDVMLSALTHHTDRDDLTGTAASLGRALTWTGRTTRKREVRVSVTPREGRTTIRVTELLKEPIKGIYGLIMGAGGGGLGGMFFGSTVASNGALVAAGLTMWGLIGALSFLAARTAHDEYSKKRQAKAKELLEALAAQTRELARPAK
ncbi:MAG: hypothetical protein ABIR92_06840, partial [Gemmatimonadaceae bacterium]